MFKNFLILLVFLLLTNCAAPGTALLGPVITGAKTKIRNFETVFTSAPSFLKIMKSLGAKFEIQK